ncbi:SOS response-associated peptidase [Abyssibacter profundi]|uniref:Abasic site processing protein n=1 Tax=Abyssibacter profundi TaxID=2182787 RepID=A0A383XQD7_9GAMM|nr:SOS response-associated peptidase [Abyssibacter profundi]PWN54841.1 SOS response-associated peptidase [Abyssibacter profundi]
MCGRFEQHVARMRAWTQLLDDWPGSVVDRHNICPTQSAATFDAEGYRERHWSLIPRWARDPKLKFATFNARGETLADKNTFRGAWQHSQRCVVPASGYFEWTGPKGNKQCHYVTSGDEAGLALAGLWECWQRADATVHSFTIVTVAAAEHISWLHHRMPLMLRPDQLDTWLTGAPEHANELIRAAEAPQLSVRPVAHPNATAPPDSTED